jgi:DNA-binding NarL/FixJ family response regulator
VNVLVVSADPAVRQQMELTVRSVERTLGRPFDAFLQASDGVQAIAMVRRRGAGIVVADEITSRAGAFAIARDLKGADPPFPGFVAILLERSQDAWLARWSGADAWFVKPADPFEVADRLAEFMRGEEKEAV